MHEDKQKKNCANGNTIVYLCAEPTCKNHAPKCANFQACPKCKQHINCPREQKFSYVEKIMRENFNKRPKEHINKYEKIVDDLKHELDNLKSKLDDRKQMHWGLSAPYRRKDWWRNVPAYTNEITKQGEQTFPSLEFYSPPLFQSDINRVRRVLQNLNQRGDKIYRVYQFLAETEVSLKKLDRKPENERASILKQCGENFMKAVKNRFAINSEFLGAEDTISPQEIKHFKKVSELLIKKASHHYDEVFSNRHRSFQIGELPVRDLKNHEEVVEICLLLFDDRQKEFMLSKEEFKERYENLVKLEGVLAFFSNKYQIAYQKLKQVNKNDRSDILQMLAKSCQELGMFEEMIYYLERLKQKNPQDQEVIQKLAVTCEKEYLAEKAYLNYRNLLKQIKDDEDNVDKKINCEQKCLEWCQKGSLQYNEAIHLEAIIKMSERARNIKSELEARYKFAIYKWSQAGKTSALETVNHALRRCDQTFEEEESIQSALREIEEKQRESGEPSEEPKPVPFDKKVLEFVQQIQRKLLILKAEYSDDIDEQDKASEKALSLLGKSKSKLYEMYFVRAKILKKKELFEEAIQMAEKANKVYPSRQCYLIICFCKFNLFYRKKDHEYLDRAVAVAQQALSLKDNDYDLLHFQGICLQTLGRFRESLMSFEKALQSGEGTAQLHSRIAQNYELVAKQEDDKEKLLEIAEHHYEESLKLEPEHEKSLLGLGRILRDQKIEEKQQRAETLFKMVVEMNGSLKSQACLHLGYLYEFWSQKYEPIDYGKLQIALTWYLQASKRRETQRHLVRVYELLDQPRRAQQISEEDWP